jgi:hypothetical protein
MLRAVLFVLGSIPRRHIFPGLMGVWVDELKGDVVQQGMPARWDLLCVP